MGQKSIYRNILLFFFACLLAFGAITFALSKIIKGHLESSVNTYITETFADDVRYYLLRGNQPEVYKKCKKLSQKEFIDSLMVTDSNGDIVCSFGSPERFSISHKKKIYFDSEREGLLSTINIGFNSNFHNLVISIASISVLSFFLLTALLALVYFRKALAMITAPFERLINRIRVLGIDAEGLSYFEDLKSYKESGHIYSLISKLASAAQEQQEKAIRDNRSIAIYEISRQVLHDIRSPLTTLRKISQMPEMDKEVFSYAVSRVEQIASDLSSNITATHVCFVHITVLRLIQEKKVEYKDRNVEIKFSSQNSNLFRATNLSEIEISRMLSNLINNSVEACENESCNISISLTKNDDSITLTIDDDGPGIPPENREAVLQRGVSFKKNGSGLGLHHCLSVLSKKQGSIELSESPDGGLRVTLIMKRSIIPDDVFSSNVEFMSRVHVIDDESELINRLKHVPHIDFIHIRSPEEARKNLEVLKDGLVFVDYNFESSTENGLTLIKDIQSPNKYLVTNDFDNYELVKAALSQGIKIIPKPFVEYVNSSLFWEE